MKKQTPRAQRKGSPPASPVVTHAVHFLLAGQAVEQGEEFAAKLLAAFPSLDRLEPGFGALVRRTLADVDALVVSISQSWVATGYEVHCPGCGGLHDDDKE